MAVSRARMPASPLENSLIAEEELRQARLEAHVVADERDEREAGALLRQPHILHHPAPARSQSGSSTVLLCFVCIPRGNSWWRGFRVSSRWIRTIDRPASRAVRSVKFHNFHAAVTWENHR